MDSIGAGTDIQTGGSHRRLKVKLPVAGEEIYIPENTPRLRDAKSSLQLSGTFGHPGNISEGHVTFWTLSVFWSRQMQSLLGSFIT